MNSISDLNHRSSFHYHLPSELIAHAPVNPRDHSRLMVLNRKDQSILHYRFDQLPDFLNSGDLLIANNSKVMRARFLGNRILPDGSLGGKVEFVMLEPFRPTHDGPETGENFENCWEGLFHASAKYVRGLRFKIAREGVGELIGELIRGSSESPHGTVVVKFDRDPLNSNLGLLPLPHYIERDQSSLEGQSSQNDHESYQTIYAKEMGSAAAPTAGLHFTHSLHENLKSKGILWDEVTLHVGLGTFRPVKVDQLEDHQMHSERYYISKTLIDQIESAKRNSNKIVAVGTTSVRTLESYWKTRESGHEIQFKNEVYTGRTELFIRPGHFEFQVVDALITNFHLPESTLLMLVSTFAGRDFIMKAYEEAVRLRYRFFSYGDAMLIL